MDDKEDLGQYLKAEGVFREKSATEWAFNGMLFDPSGRFIANVSSTLPREWFLTLSPRKRVGRPKDEARHVSVAGHMAMSAPIEQGRLKKTRIDVANLLGIGNSGGKRGVAQPDNQNKQIKNDHCAKAHDSLDGLSGLVCMGDENGKGRLIAFFERGSRVTHERNGFKIDGHGWLVGWGQARAEYGRIQAAVKPVNPSDNLHDLLRQHFNSELG
jgi:hypothetical protein